MSDDKKVIFSMQKLSKTYKGADKPVLKNIYLSFFYGAKIGILGLNGSGKSSLFDALLHWYRMKSQFGYDSDESSLPSG